MKFITTNNHSLGITNGRTSLFGFRNKKEATEFVKTYFNRIERQQPDVSYFYSDGEVDISKLFNLEQ